MRLKPVCQRHGNSLCYSCGLCKCYLIKSYLGYRTFETCIHRLLFIVSGRPVVIMTVGQPGPDLPSAGPCSEKMWGPFTWKKLATFFIHHRPRASCQFSWKTSDLFAHYSRCSLRGCPLFRYFGSAKNSPLLLLRPLFVGALVRPNMLNMPKSAAAGNLHKRTSWPQGNSMCVKFEFALKRLLLFAL